MNILLVNHYAGTPTLGMEFRPYYLAREWVRAGHRVRIVAATYSHVRARQPEPPAGATPDAVFDTEVDGIAYRWIPTPRYRGNGLGRVRNIAAFLARLWRGGPAWVRAERPDVVIASSTYPLDIWVARRLARIAGAKLVHEVHDLWPLSPVELSGMSPRHPFIRLCQKAEDDACRDADLVVSMLPKVGAHMAAHGLPPERLVIVPNGVALDDWERPPEPLGAELSGRLDAAWRAAGRSQAPTATSAPAPSAAPLIVGYAGSMGLPNALDVLLDAAALLRDEPFAFVLIGDGHEAARLRERVGRERLANVTLLPPVPKAQIPTLLARFDIAYIGWQRVPIYRFGIAPNKLMDYMMAARPVLHSVAAGNDPVAEAGCGLTVAPESASAVADGLRRLAACSAAERAAMGARGKAYVVAQHDYRVLAARFVAAVEGVERRGAAHG